MLEADEEYFKASKTSYKIRHLNFEQPAILKFNAKVGYLIS